MYFFQDEKRSSDRNSVYSRDASGDRSDKYRNQDMSSLPSSPAPPPRPLSSIASGFYIYLFIFKFVKLQRTLTDFFIYFL